MAKQDVDEATGELLPAESPIVQLIPFADDEADGSSDTIERILNAKSLDEAMVEQTTLGLRDLTGRVVTIYGAKLRRSTVTGGESVYAVIDAAVDRSDEHKVITCGSAFVLAVIAKAYQLGELPFDAVPYELASKSNPGQTSLWLRRIKPL